MMRDHIHQGPGLEEKGFPVEISESTFSNFSNVVFMPSALTRTPLQNTYAQFPWATVSSYPSDMNLDTTFSPSCGCEALILEAP